MKIILGTMKSGKSTILINEMINAFNSGNKYVFIRQSKDKRDFIARDINIEIKKYNFKSEKYLFNDLKNHIIFIDEIQFLNKNILDRIIELSINNKIIMAGLLSYTDTNKIWESVAYILPYCREIQKLNAYCEKCGKHNATIQHFQGGNKISDNYTVYCLECYNKIIKLN
ncbi:hypothetical protein [Campylobacter sp. RM12651]|uniref:hypothetical protein n=1 Tax=Campylobacter sp. RM12651 TaxID=1660079 RepID=UPI001EFB8AAE|nr:hypothetical protein [Campylobacter sp. RM12651]ULO04594.1 thymidine kinase [Campylobacter sp. RM12651]